MKMKGRFLSGPASWMCRRVWKPRRKVLFVNHTGSGYRCNPKYVCEELVRRGFDGELVWMGAMTREERKRVPARVKCVSLHGLGAIRHFATAKVWVDNVSVLRFLERGLVKKPGQTYIQTWHGSMGLKRDSMDLENPPPEQVEALKRETPLVDYCIANSEFEAGFFERGWFGDRKILLYGHPRNDVFFGDAEPLRRTVRAALGIADGVKLFLYAPTFRDGGGALAALRPDAVLAALEERFGGEWAFLFRSHPKAKGRAPFPDCSRMVDVTDYDDMQELLVAADAMATDYSSCICDFVLGGRPAFIFAPDLREFLDKGRGLCYPLETTPFPVAETERELADAIRTFDADRYEAKRQAFLADKGCREDGNASSRVADLVEAALQR